MHSQIEKSNLSRREQERARRRKIQTRNTILIYGGIALIIIILALLLFIPNLSSQSQAQAVTISEIEPLFMANFNQAGDPSAPIKLEIFSDFNCSHCKEFNDNLEQKIIADYVSTGKVFMTYISFPILGSSSVTSAEAAYCAGEQGKFWEYKDTLYLNVGKTINPFSESNLVSYARKLGLNVADWQECFGSNQFTEKIEDDLEYGKSIGVEGTPSFNVNGTIVYQTTLLATIEQLLTDLEQ